MSQQQPNSDLLTNLNHTILLNGNALSVALARADVLARAALIIRACALLEDLMSAPATQVCRFLIKVSRFRFFEKMSTTIKVTFMPPLLP